MELMLRSLKKSENKTCSFLERTLMELEEFRKNWVKEREVTLVQDSAIASKLSQMGSSVMFQSCIQSSTPFVTVVINISLASIFTHTSMLKTK
jgi:hypothetical protein